MYVPSIKIFTGSGSGFGRVPELLRVFEQHYEHPQTKSSAHAKAHAYAWNILGSLGRFHIPWSVVHYALFTIYFYF